MSPLPNIGLIGRARTGKDTAAFILARRHGYTRMAFADRLRDLLGAFNPIVGTVNGSPIRYMDALGTLGYEGAKDTYPEVRRSLQHLGTGARDVLGDNVWVDALIRRAEAHPAGSPVVVTDVRFPNEANRLRAAGFILVRLTRMDAPSSGNHISETALDGYAADMAYANDGDLADLERFLGSVLQATEVGA